MTCIVGLVDGGRVWMGGDSASMGADSLEIRRDPKVCTRGEYAVGCTDSWRMAQLLRYAPGMPNPTGDLHRFMVMEFVDWMRTVYREAGWLAKETNGEERGGLFLVGVRGHLFTVEADHQVGEPYDRYSAVGTGGPVALGALYATAGQEPRERLRTALRAAERMRVGVRGPFRIVSV